MVVVDGHEDIAYNMLHGGRDYTTSAQAIRQAERSATPPGTRPTCTLGLADWLAGKVGLIFATLFVEPARPTALMGGPLYRTPHQAHAQAMAQLDAYHRLADEQPRFRLVTAGRDLDEVLAGWQAPQPPEARQIGLVVLMEGADPIVTPHQVETWYARGLRLVGLAWVGTRYAGGTHEPGPLTQAGRELLRVMDGLNMGLDLSHCAEQAYYQALESYGGPVLASHSNPRRFVDRDRHLSDAMIRRLVERDGVIGLVPLNPMLKPDWKRGDPKTDVTLADVIAAIDYVCQLAGDARHAALGTDFDGGFGVADIPAEFDTIADVLKIADGLRAAGYAPADVEAIMGGNWLRLLRQVLP